MAWRITDDDLRSIIATDTSVRVDWFIRMANSLTDEVSSNDTDGDLDVTRLRLIEINLAAHFYEARDQQYAEKKTDDASAVFQGQWGPGLARTSYGQQAMDLDTTGYLRGKTRGATVGVVSAHRAPSEQTDYVDRD